MRQDGYGVLHTVEKSAKFSTFWALSYSTRYLTFLKINEVIMETLLWIIFITNSKALKLLD